MEFQWFMIPDEFIQARMFPGKFKFSIYGTYKTNSLIYIICMFLGNQEDLVIDFATSRSASEGAS
jgi:hypothetical protein